MDTLFRRYALQTQSVMTGISIGRLLRWRQITSDPRKALTCVWCKTTEYLLAGYTTQQLQEAWRRVPFIPLRTAVLFMLRRSRHQHPWRRIPKQPPAPSPLTPKTWPEPPQTNNSEHPLLLFDTPLLPQPSLMVCYDKRRGSEGWWNKKSWKGHGGGKGKGGGAENMDSLQTGLALAPSISSKTQKKTKPKKANPITSWLMAGGQTKSKRKHKSDSTSSSSSELDSDERRKKKEEKKEKKKLRKEATSSERVRARYGVLAEEANKASCLGTFTISARGRLPGTTSRRTWRPCRRGRFSSCSRRWTRMRPSA